jgi:hypothetical protein
VRTGGLRVGMGSIGLGKVKGVEAPGASGPYFTGVTSLGFPHSMLKARVWNWVPVAKVDKVVHRAVAFPQAPRPV